MARRHCVERDNKIEQHAPQEVARAVTKNRSWHFNLFFLCDFAALRRSLFLLIKSYNSLHNTNNEMYLRFFNR